MCVHAFLCVCDRDIACTCLKNTNNSGYVIVINAVMYKMTQESSTSSALVFQNLSIYIMLIMAIWGNTFRCDWPLLCLKSFHSCSITTSCVISEHKLQVLSGLKETSWCRVTNNQHVTCTCGYSPFSIIAIYNRICKQIAECINTT